MSLTTPPTPGPRPTATTRREFAATLALTALGACVNARGAGPAAAAPPTPAPTGPAPAAGSVQTPDPVTDALVAVVAARYGADVVPPADRTAFRDAVGRTVELSRRLRGAPVANGVDPFASFCPPSAGARETPVAAPATPARRTP
jgi:hypothetical protein